MNPPDNRSRREAHPGEAVIGARIAALLLVSALAGCGVRELPAPIATCADVEPILLAKCASCHGAERAEGGYRVDSCIAAIACPTDAASAVAPPDTSAPILAVLARPAPDPHAGLLTAVETALLREWVETGSPLRTGGMHAAGWADPRSDAFHGTALRDERFSRMLDPDAVGACARCHAGTLGTIDPAMYPAAGATACTSCHREAGGPTACTTCHGSAGRAYPPRDLCLHPEQRPNAGGAHVAHVVRQGFACAMCHSEHTIAQLSDPTSEHNNGMVDVHLDAALAGEGATYDAATNTCAGTRCHLPNASGMLSPEWFSTAGLTCQSCHGSPPENHFAGPCDTCHSEAPPEPALGAIYASPLHMNGVVDFGHGGQACGACHGVGDDPMPSEGSHVSHVRSTLSAPIACTNCHVVPTVETIATAPEHLDRLSAGAATPADVTFAGSTLASARGATPVRDAVSGTCSDVACHGNRLGDGITGGGEFGGGGTYTTPRWGDTSGLAARCGSCHSIPPPPATHTVNANCSTIGCHGGYVAMTPEGPRQTTMGVAAHVNGTVDLWVDMPVTP